MTTNNPEISSEQFKKEESVSKDEADTGIQFMLAEFSNIRGFKEQSVTIGDKRVDVFLTLSSALFAGFGLLSQTGITNQHFQFIVLGGSISLLVLGVVVFQQVIDRDILVVDYIRYMNRIRGYFAEKAPHLQQYLLMPTSYNFPKYDWQSSIRSIPMVVNSVASGITGATLSMAVRKIEAPDFVSIIWAGLAFLLSYVLHSVYAKQLFDKAEAKAKTKQTVTLFESLKSVSSE